MTRPTNAAECSSSVLCPMSSHQEGEAFAPPSAPSPGKRRVIVHLAATLMVLWPVASGAQLRTLGVARSVLEVTDAPEWLSLPSSAEIRAPSGVRVEVVSTSIVSNEARKEAALVGMFRNVGRALSGAALSLTYIGSDGQSMVASASNGALVSAVHTDGLLPFRFPLLRSSLLPGKAAAIRVSIQEDVAAARRPVAAQTAGKNSVRGLGQGVIATGHIDLSPPDDQDTGESLVLTAVLLDSNRQVLEVLTGKPVRVTASRYKFELRGTMPVANKTRDVQVWVEAAGPR